MFKKIKNLKEKTNQTSGITLVALIITIIVLIILAGVTISIALGENGIFRKSKKAASEYQKSAEREETEMDKALIYMGEKPEFNAEELKIGEAINADKYGWKVEGYQASDETAQEEVGCWRLFYQDNRCTYLISDELIKGEGGIGFEPRDYYNSITKEGSEELKYQSGADVSTIGQRLNPMLLKDGNFFTESNTNSNILATAWLTDPSQWEEYTNEDAEFAIGSPTVELYAASFDASADASKEEGRTKIKEGLGVGQYGYTENVTSGQLQQNYNKGIYNKDEKSYCWLASPGGDLYFVELDVDGGGGSIGRDSEDNWEFPIRPIVCIQTSVFEVQYANSLTNE